MNWVLVFAGLLPLWAAIFIVFSNMRVLKDDPTLMEPAPVQVEKPVQNIVIEEKPKEPEEKEEQKSIFSGLLGRFRRGNSDEPKLEEEINFTEPSSSEAGASLGIPRWLKRLWGATFVLIFIACLAYGSEKGLDYLFKEYRWVIGTTNPWTSQLRFASMATLTIAGIATMISTLRTGLFLLKR